MGGLSDENKLIEQITDVGNKLLHPPTITHQLLNLLDEVEFVLTKVGQAPSRLVQEAILIPMKALIADDLLGHSDPNVKITLVSCLNEVMRITAPIPPYDDDKMREIFELMVSSYENLSCQPGRCYSKAVLILQSVAKLRSCVMMLDIDCASLVIKMFELFQRIISPKHPEDVLLAMVNIMSVIIQESDSVSPELLKVLLASIRMENQSVSPASWELGAKVFEGCAYKLRPFIMETVASMGCCLEDYAPVLSSICKPEPDTVMNGINDSSFLVNSEPYDNPSHPAETERFEFVNASGTGGTASKRRRKQNCKNIDDEATGLHQLNDQPSGNLSHPADHYVQALEAIEGFESFDALETGKTPKRSRKHNSQNLDEEASGLQYVQALEAAESSENVNALVTGGTTSEREIKSISKILVEEATGVECEQSLQGTADDDIAKTNGIIRKDMASKIVKEEIVGFEDKQACHSPVTGDSIKRKRGRPRKKDVIEVSEDRPSKKKNDVSEVPSSTEKVIETPHGRINYKDDLVGRRVKVWWPLDRRYYEGSITMFDASAKKHKVNYDDGDEEIVNLRKERWEFIGDKTPN